MNTKLIVILALSVAASQACETVCNDYYRNCKPMNGLESDKPDEVINCAQEEFQLKCPLLCKECTQCDFVLASTFEGTIDKLEQEFAKEVDAMETANQELEGDIKELMDEIEELKNAKSE